VWAALFLWPDIDIDIDLPIDNPLPDVEGIIRDGFNWFLDSLASGVLNGIGVVLSIGYEQFLFYPNPAKVPVLDTIWWISLGAFSAVAGLSFMYMLLMAQLFPGKDKADLQYFLERVAKYFVIVFISREIIAFFVTVSHTVAGVYYQSSVDLTVGISIALDVIRSFGLGGTVMFMILASLALIVAGVGFIVILIMRMLIVYLTFALLPLLMAFKLVEIGPWKMVSQMGEKFVKASVKMMVFGTLITALLWTSTLALDHGDYSGTDGSYASPGPAPDTSVDGSFSTPTVIRDFIMFITPLLMINFIGFKIIMGIV